MKKTNVFLGKTKNNDILIDLAHTALSFYNFTK